MSVWLLFVALLATSIGQSVVMTLLPPLGREAGLSEFQVAAILSSSALIFAIGTTLWGRATQRFGRKRILLIGLGGYTLGTLLFSSVFYAGLEGLLAGSSLFAALLISRALQSTIMSATPPAALGIAIALSEPDTTYHSTPHPIQTNATNRIRAISRVTSANSLGQVLGPLLGGTLAIFGLLVPLYTIAAFTCLALGLVAFKLPSDKPAPASLAPPTHSPTPISATHWASLRYVIIAAALFCAMAMLHQTLGFFFMDELGMTPTEAAQRVGIAAMIIALVSVAVQFGFVQRTQCEHTRLLLIGLGVLTTAYITLTLFHTLAGTYSAMVLLGIGMGLSYPATTAAATASGDTHQQARATGLISAAPAMGFVIGPPLAALLYQLSAVGPFAAAILLMVAMLMLHRWPSTADNTP